MVTPPEVILGPPGTGKTTALLRIVEEELGRGVAPDRIGYVTFTRRAAEEAVARACAKFQLTPKQLPHFRTLHSMCFRQLGLSSSDVLEGPRMREFARHADLRMTGRWSEDGSLTGFELGDRLLFMENLARIRGVPLRQLYDEWDDNLPWRELERAQRALAEWKVAKGLLDYTDMLSEFVRLGIRIGLEVLAVDEAQDLSHLQWGVVGCLMEGCRRVVIAGDDDQAIYRWAGADVDHLIDLEGSVSVLDQSYRVPEVVQTLAGQVIEHVSHRRLKAWSPRPVRGELGRAGDLSDVDLSQDWAGEGEVQPILVMARNTYILRDQVEPDLRRAGIIYEMNGHPSIRPALLEDITNWEHLRQGREVLVTDARRIYVHMTSGKGVARGHKTLPGFTDDESVSIEVLEKAGGLLTRAIWHEALDRLPQDDVAYIVAARQRGERLRARPRVRLSTIHGSKGGEATHVVLFREMARRTYREMELSPEDEARVWYVGVTRTRERLTLVDSTTRQECPWL